jgi:hypothetical protein
MQIQGELAACKKVARSSVKSKRKAHDAEGKLFTAERQLAAAQAENKRLRESVIKGLVAKNKVLRDHIRRIHANYSTTLNSNLGCAIKDAFESVEGGK